MTTGLVGALPGGHAERAPSDRLYGYFWSDAARRVQTVLALIWLLDGGLQFQSFMYTRGFLQSLIANAQGQPGWVHDSIIWGAHFANGDLTVWNTLFALAQCLIGIGILYRPLTKLTLGLSLAWVLVVWWFGEGFGMVFMDAAQPLTGAPGGVFMYGLIALIAWPNGRPGGLFGARGAKTMWCALWLVMASFWLLAASSSANATKSMLTSVPSGIHPLDSLQSTLARASGGDGLVIALVLAAVTAAIAIAVAADWHPRAFLVAAIVLNVLYWVIPQGLGGIFAGGATDPNAGPLFVLLACAMFPLFPRHATAARAPDAAFAPSTTSAAGI